MDDGLLRNPSKYGKELQWLENGLQSWCLRIRLSPLLPYAPVAKRIRLGPSKAAFLGSSPSRGTTFQDFSDWVDIASHSDDN